MSAVLVSGLTLKVDESVLREFFSYRRVSWTRRPVGARR